MSEYLTSKIIHLLRGNTYLVFALLWVLLWIFPWLTWLHAVPWIRLGITMILFVTPGTIASLFLVGERFSFTNHVVSGFAFSVLFVGALGLLGRIIHVPFDFIKSSFALTGLVFLTLASFKLYLFDGPVVKPVKVSGKTLFVLLLLIAFGIIINFSSRTTGDDQSYLAYLTSWQHANPLNFQDVYFDSGNIDGIRFWLAMFPMSLALLAEMSNLHGLLLIGFYLEPFLIGVAILATYHLYEHFLQQEWEIIAALLLQFTFLFLLRGHQQPGLTFFDRLSEDKVIAAFVLFPVFFLSASFLLECFNVRSAIFFMLSGFSVALTHAVILAFSIFIIGVYASIVTILREEYKKATIIGILLALIVFPVGLLRFIDVPSASSIPYDLESALEIGAGIENRISYIEGTPFYGFKLEKLQIITNNPKSLLWTLLSYSFIWIVGLGFLWSVFNLRRNILAPFIVATSLLTLLSAIPYTGWIIGYFVSARMLWRVPWLLPFGLIGFILLNEVLHSILYKMSISSLSRFAIDKVVYILIVGTSSLLIFFFSVFVYRADWDTLAEINDYHDTLENLSALGDYLEANIEEPSRFVAAAQSSHHLTGLFTQSMMDYLPGLSSKSKVVFFRWFPAPYLADRDKLNLIFSLDSSVAFRQRINILRKNHVQYVLIDDPSLEEYYARAPQLFDIHNVGNYWILKLHGSVP